MAAELCTRLHVQTAVLKLKCLSSQLKAVRSIVERATRNIGAIKLFPVRHSSLFSFFLSFYLFFPLNFRCLEADSNHRKCEYLWVTR